MGKNGETWNFTKVEAVVLVFKGIYGRSNVFHSQGVFSISDNENMCPSSEIQM